VAASDHLSEQFYDAPNGKKYRLQHEGWNAVHATPVGKVKPVGYVSFFPDGGLGNPKDPDRPTVFKAFVKPAHRRVGLASALFDHADQVAQSKYGKPLQHSGSLSEDGKAFVEGHLRKRGNAS
jgi:GNAT superfamily N-acetyltransferase